MNAITNLFYSNGKKIDEELLQATFATTTEFNLWGYKTKAKAVKQDGCVIWFAFRLADAIQRFRTRLVNIEIANRSSKNPAEVDNAILAEQRIFELLSNKIVDLQCYKTDANKNILVDVFIDGKNLSEILLTEKLAYSYYGGSKQNFESWYKL